MRFRLVKHFSGVMAAFALVMTGCQTSSRAKKPYTYEFSYGESTLLRGDGRAIPPKTAPGPVKAAIAAGNRIQGKPYVYGGGHKRLEDRGYDCSGTVSYALINAGLLESPAPSKYFTKYGKPGPGKWITIYAKYGHTFMTVGGLRLDTGWRDDERRGPKWQTRSRPTKGYTMRHPAGF